MATLATTKLAATMNVLHSRIEPLTPAARRSLNRVLRRLDDDERSTLVLLDAVGKRDWDMVDGTRRVWHFTASGDFGWNDISDHELDAVVARAEQLIGRDIEPGEASA
jgi:hypothetical protein